MRPRLIALSAASALLLAGCGSSGKHTAATTTTTTATRDAAGCLPAGTPSLGPRSAPKPTAKLGPALIYDVTIQTNCGAFTIQLDPKQSPNASSSFASLAKRGYFDHTIFHRIVVGFVIQGGDPTGTGTAGPGYKTVDTPPTGVSYTQGVVAMAKTAIEKPGTAGSQFFVVTGANVGLAPDYAIIGKVVEGLDVVDRIGKLGDPSQQPTETVEIVRATLKTHK